MIDLWPNELSTVDQRSPLTILKEQASLLGEKTQNIVIAVLEDAPLVGSWLPKTLALASWCASPGGLRRPARQKGPADPRPGAPTGERLPKNYPFKYGFLLTCPALSHYRFRLFSIAYDIDIYPVRFHLDSDVAEEIIEETHVELGMNGNLQASNEEEFIEILRRIFSSRKTVRVIRALLSQAKS